MQTVSHVHVSYGHVPHVGLHVSHVQRCQHVYIYVSCFDIFVQLAVAFEVSPLTSCTGGIAEQYQEETSVSRVSVAATAVTVVASSPAPYLSITTMTITPPPPPRATATTSFGTTFRRHASCAVESALSTSLPPFPLLPCLPLKGQCNNEARYSNKLRHYHHTQSTSCCPFVDRWRCLYAWLRA